MDRKDWIIRHLAQRLVYLGDCTMKRIDVEVCPLQCIGGSGLKPRDACIGCILDSAEDAWRQMSEGSPFPSGGCCRWHPDAGA